MPLPYKMLGNAFRWFYWAFNKSALLRTIDSVCEWNVKWPHFTWGENAQTPIDIFPEENSSSLSTCKMIIGNLLIVFYRTAPRCSTLDNVLLLIELKIFHCQPSAATTGVEKGLLLTHPNAPWVLIRLHVSFQVLPPASKGRCWHTHVGRLRSISSSYVCNVQNHLCYTRENNRYASQTIHQIWPDAGSLKKNISFWQHVLEILSAPLFTMSIVVPFVAGYWTARVPSMWSWMVDCDSFTIVLQRILQDDVRISDWPFLMIEMYIPLS